MRCLVEELMTSVEECIVLLKTDTINKFKAEIRSKNQRTAIVMDSRDSIVEGVITASDIVLAEPYDLVSDHWSVGAYTIEPDKPISIARKTMNEKKSHQLIVVDSDMHPLGIIWDHIANAGCIDKPT